MRPVPIRPFDSDTDSDTDSELAGLVLLRLNSPAYVIGSERSELKDPLK